MIRISRRHATTLLLLGTAGAVCAQTPQPPAGTVRIRGAIRSIDGNILTVTTREGPEARIMLNDPLAVFTVKKLDFSAIVPGSYIGTAAVPGPDGILTALEIYVFPPAGRGNGEGHGPWDLAPNSTMTNANVDAVVQGTAGNVLTLTPKGTSVKVTAPLTIPIVTTVPGQREDLKPGETIFIFAASRAADGTLSAGRITVSKDGIAPPM